MKRIAIKWVMLTFCFIMFVTSSKAYSTWQYAQEKLKDITQMANTTLKVFEYEPEEVLPDDEIGKNHVALVEDLIGDNNGNGLNNPNSYLNQQIKKRQNIWYRDLDTLGSMGVDQQDELEKIFTLDSKNLSFLIQFVNDTTYYIFTTEVEFGENGAPNYKIGEEYISPIYRTLVKNINGIWEAQTSAKGYALSAYYEESNLFGNVTKIPSFDADTWQAGNLIQ